MRRGSGTEPPADYEEQGLYPLKTLTTPKPRLRLVPYRVHRALSDERARAHQLRFRSTLHVCQHGRRLGASPSRWQPRQHLGNRWKTLEILRKNATN